LKMEKDDANGSMAMTMASTSSCNTSTSTSCVLSSGSVGVPSLGSQAAVAAALDSLSGGAAAALSLGGIDQSSLAVSNKHSSALSHFFGVVPIVCLVNLL
jgi:hypothetical protein